MKLLKLHIENYGKLSNFDYSFSDGINTICEENSFGKTTLGSFIKVMFFGFDRESSRKNDRERTKYKPWQGGTYGGTIWFEIEDKRYEMTRVFGDKTADDTFSLRDMDTLLESDDYTKDGIGREIFSVDGGSFERTMFISQNDYEYGDKTDIDTKIGNLVDNTDDLNNYDSAVARLESGIGEISTKRGGRGKLDQIKTQISELQFDVARKNSVIASISELNKEFEELNDQIAEKGQEIDRISASIDQLSEWQQMSRDKVEYESLLSNYDHFNTIDSVERTYFNNVIPEKEELGRNLSEADKLSVNKTVMRENKLDENEEVKLIQLQRKYADKDLSSIRFDQKEQQIQKCSVDRNWINKYDLTSDERTLFDKEAEVFSAGFKKEINDVMVEQWDNERQTLTQNINSLKLSATEDDKLKALQDKFSSHVPDKEEIEEEKRKWSVDRAQLLTDIGACRLSNYEEQELERLSAIFAGRELTPEIVDEKLNKVSEINEYEEKLQLNEQKVREASERLEKISIFHPLFSIGIILTLFGLLCAFVAPNMEINLVPVTRLYPDIPTIGYALIGVGILMALLSFFLITRKKQKVEKEIISALKDEAAVFTARKESLINELNEWLGIYGKAYDNNVVFTINNLNQEYDSYARLIAQVSENTQKKIRLTDEVQTIEDGLKDILADYGYGYDEQNVLYYLSKIVGDYEDMVDLEDKKAELDTRQAESRARIREIEASCHDYLEKYQISCPLTSYSANLHDLQRRYDEYARLYEKKSNKQLETYKTEHDQLANDLHYFFNWYLKDDVKEENFFSMYAQLKTDEKDLRLLQDKKNKYEDAMVEYNNIADALSRYIRSFSFTVEENIRNQLNVMQDHFQTYDNNLEPLGRARWKKENFEQEHPHYQELMNFDKEVDDDAIKALNNQRNQLQGTVEDLRIRRNFVNDQLESLNDTFNDICDKEGQIETLKESRADLEERLNILKLARDFLQKAKASLNARYTAPLNNSLARYFDILAQGSDLNITMDVNKELIIRSNGIETTEKNLSEGYKDIVDICYRFALIDAMYTDEQPIIILDDPFINLDPEKIANGLNLLKEVAKDKQILYLTCHDARVI